MARILVKKIKKKISFKIIEVLLSRNYNHIPSEFKLLSITVVRHAELLY